MREAFVGDGRLAQIEHLQVAEVFADELEALVAELGRPQVEIEERGQLDEMLGACARHVGEGQAEALEVAERARLEQLGEVLVRRAARHGELARSALLLQLAQLHLPLAHLHVHAQTGGRAAQRVHYLTDARLALHAVQIEHCAKCLYKVNEKK